MNQATQFAASLGLRYPIFQAPVGSMAGPELAAAVSQAGGMGALALTWTSPQDATRLIETIRAKTERPFQVNFVLAFKPRSLTAALEAGARVVTFSWGLPSSEIALVRSFEAQLGIQVTTPDGARRALDLGANFLICQGLEAGGHVQATQSLWDTLPCILQVAQSIPVIAAGGIGDGQAIARAVALGASGAMLGTRFVATQESQAHEFYKQRLVQAVAKNTTLTICFDGDWPHAPHRVLRNSTLENWEAAGCPPVGQRPGEGDLISVDPAGQTFLRYDDTPPRAAMIENAMTGNLEAMCLYAGTSCDSINDIPHASELVERLWLESELANNSTSSGSS